MPKLSGYKDFSISPLNGQMDLRSPTGTLGLNAFRLVLNMALNEDKKLCRLAGFKRLFADSIFGFFNQDLHDQLEDCLTYFDSYTYHSIHGYGPTGDYAYPFFIPPVTGNPTLQFKGLSDIYCGYPEDFYPFYHHDGLANTDGTPTMIYTRTGYPYNYPDYPVDGICHDVAWPDAYGGSYFYLNNWAQESTMTPGYFYGAPVPVYTNGYDYETQYCGTTEHKWPSCREPITMLAEGALEDTGRKLLAATKSKIYALNESSANWMVLADGLGGEYRYDQDCASCNSRRFVTTRLGGIQLFSNDFDPVLYWRFESPIGGCRQWRAQYVDELLAVGITKVKVIGSWKGFAFYGNVEQEGQSFPSRIFWSDFNAPLSIIPGGNSLASETDLGFGQEILRFETLGGQARLYTDKAIYEVLLVGGDEVFRFLEIYRGPDALKYTHSLVNIGKAHLYLGQTGIFTLEEYGRSPIRVEWQHKASGAIFNGVSATDLIGFPYLAPFGPINKDQCDQVIGWFDSERKTIWFSWPTDDNVCPNMSLTLNLQYGFSSLVDKGFTAGVSYTSDPRQSLLDWLRTNQVCNFDAFADQLQKIGVPYDSSSNAFPNPPAHIFNATEDPSLPSDPDSLCARLGGLSIEDLCGEDCRTRVVMVVADAIDHTIKEYSDDFLAREMFVDTGLRYECPYSTDGVYTLEPYSSLMMSDMNKLGRNEEKAIRLASIDYIAGVQAVPSLLRFQIGYSSQPGCVTWRDATPCELKCLTEKTAAEHLANNTRPNTMCKFPVHWSGVFLGYRFYITGLGGKSCFSEVKLEIRLKAGCW